MIDLQLWSYCINHCIFFFLLWCWESNLATYAVPPAFFSAFLKGRIVYVLLILLNTVTTIVVFWAWSMIESQQVVQKRVPKCWNSHLKLWVNWMYPVGTIGFKILPDDLIINTQRARNVSEIRVLFTVCCRVDAQGVLFLKLFRSHWTVVSECGSNCLLALVFIFIDNTWNSTKAWRTQNGAFGTERETPRTSGFTAVETSKYNSAKNSVNNIFHIYFLMYWVKLLLQTSNLRTNAGW